MTSVILVKCQASSEMIRVDIKSKLSLLFLYFSSSLLHSSVQLFSIQLSATSTDDSTLTGRPSGKAVSPVNLQHHLGNEASFRGTTAAAARRFTKTGDTI